MTRERLYIHILTVLRKQFHIMGGVIGGGDYYVWLDKTITYLETTHYTAHGNSYYCSIMVNANKFYSEYKHLQK